MKCERSLRRAVLQPWKTRKGACGLDGHCSGRCCALDGGLRGEARWRAVLPRAAASGLDGVAGAWRSRRLFPVQFRRDRAGPEAGRSTCARTPRLVLFNESDPSACLPPETHVDTVRDLKSISRVPRAYLDSKKFCTILITSNLTAHA